MPAYLIRTTIATADKPISRDRIIDAANQAQAIRHVVADSIHCEIVEVGDAMRLAAEGVKLEKAAASE